MDAASVVRACPLADASSSGSTGRFDDDACAGEESAEITQPATIALPTIRHVGEAQHNPDSRRPLDGPVPEPKPPGPRKAPALLLDMVEHKKREVEAAKVRVPFSEIESMVAQEEPPRNFFAAVTRHASKAHMAVIAEIKRKCLSSA